MKKKMTVIKISGLTTLNIHFAVAESGRLSLIVFRIIWGLN